MPGFWRRLDGGSIGALVGMITAVAALLGIGIAFLSISRRAEVEIAQFPTLDVSALLAGNTGSTVAVEGRIAGTPRFQSLIAYTYEEADRPTSDESVRWRMIEQVRPPLQVELGDGSVPVTGTYTLSGATTTLRPQDRQRYVGLVDRQTVFVWGTLRQEDAGPVLIAETIYGGTRADYLGEQHIMRLIAWIFIGLGVGLAALFTWIFTRFIMPIAATSISKRQRRIDRRRR